MDAAQLLNTALSGRYAIEREIGAGGMATVYLARDVKHNRNVALKVLRPDLGAVLGVERFLSEIQVTANLQHPNLLPLFDSGEVDGHLFYVMPYIKGESLRARLDRDKQLPVDEAVHIATAVASALDYAHRHGVIHRDLKPENILLSEGQPLVADFGIALAVSNAGGGRITQTGLSLGTPQYMSPEQATGDRVINVRTDIYSLGAVTYEMLTGDPPHVGSTSQAIIARVLTETPRAIRTTRPSVPAHVEGAIALALQKLPADRFATAHEFADALSGKVLVTAPLAAGSYAGTTGATSTAWWRDPRARVVLAGIALAWAASLVVVGMNRNRSEERSAITFTFPTQDAANSHLAVSPDGKHVAFVANSAADPQTPALWLRSLALPDARQLPGTEGAAFPFWAPDSRTVAFGAEGRIKRIDLTGGTAQVICEFRGIFGASWNDNGDIVIGATNNRGLWRVNAAGGQPASLIPVPPNAEVNHSFASFLPDGRRFLYTKWGRGAAQVGIYIASLDDTASTLVAPGASKAEYANGSILFQSNGTLFAQPFEARAGRTTGDPVRVADGVAHNASNGFASFSVSEGGTLVYRTGVTRDDAMSQLKWYSRSGREVGTIGDSGLINQVNLSYDDRRIAYGLTSPRTGTADVWVIDLTNNITDRLTSDTAGAGGPIWFPDGRTVVFQSRRQGPLNFFKRTVGESSETLVFSSSATPKYLEDISRDGRYLMYHRGNALVALRLDTANTEIVLGDSAFTNDQARFSPDGRWVAYGSLQTGTPQIHVATFPAFNDRRRVSPNGGRQARWRADGRELIYLSPSGEVMSVPVTGGEFGVPVKLFQSPISAPSWTSDQYAVTRDGQRFLFIARSAARQQAQPLEPITVVVNWRTAVAR